MHVVLIVIGLYAAIGVAVGLWFVFARVSSVDAAASDSGLPFRVLILPGCVALWPLVLRMPADGAKTSDDPATRHTRTQRSVHAVAWPILIPIVAAALVIAILGRTQPDAIDAGLVPDDPPSDAEVRP